MIDAHCHLDSFHNLQQIIDDSKKELEAIITCGFSMESNQKAINISKEYEGFVFPVVGIAPQTAMKMKNKDWEMEIPDATVAIGEIGLDWHWAKTQEEKELQKECFLYFLKLAAEIDLPVVIHSREAHDEVFSILGEQPSGKVMLHCFTGSLEHAKLAETNGWVLSFPPIPSRSRSEVAQKLNVKLVVESDAPYIGRFPLDTAKSVELIAAAKGKKKEEVAAETAMVTKEFFGLKL
jgi:TatD DNase family protein